MSFILVACVTGMMTGSCSAITQTKFSELADCQVAEKTVVRSSTYSACVPATTVKTNYIARIGTMDLVGGVARKDGIMLPNKESCMETVSHIKQSYNRKINYVYCEG